MLSINFILLIVGFLLLTSIFLGGFTSKIGIPSLLIFLFIGILFDSVSFISQNIKSYYFVQYISIFALIIIMFSGGLDTDLRDIKPVFYEGVALATVGVILTAFIVGFLIHYIFGLDLVMSLLLGSMVSSTDAAAVFGIFKSQNINLKYNLDKILEVESGTNDPMAYILLTVFMHLILNPTASYGGLILLFFKSLILGTIFGYLSGKVFALLLTKVKWANEGLYPVLLFSSAILSFAISEYFGGNGFLSVYIAALLIGNSNIVNKKAQLSFFDGLAWLMQVLMFLLLGAFTTLSDLANTFIPGLIIAILLIFIVRPIAVFITLAPSKLNIISKTFLSLTGIKGAVPIVFAFYPLVANIEGANVLFHIVMCITVVSVLLQGSSMKFLAKKFNLIEDTDINN